MKANKEYQQHLKNLDSVLKYLQGHQDEYESIFKILSVNKIPYDENTGYEIAGILEKDGYIKVIKDSTSFDVGILPKGSDFIRSGGYMDRHNKGELDYRVAKSTISANRANIFFSVVNLIFFIVNLIIAWLAYTKP